VHTIAYFRCGLGRMTVRIMIERGRVGEVGSIASLSQGFISRLLSDSDEDIDEDG
jgi:hypothetical protein